MMSQTPINKEQEIWQIETTNDLNTSAQTVINYNEILNPPLDEIRTMKIVLTKGIAGIGKTVTVQKFVHDWASGKNQSGSRACFPAPIPRVELARRKKTRVFLTCFVPCTQSSKRQDRSLTGSLIEKFCSS